MPKEELICSSKGIYVFIYLSITAIAIGYHLCNFQQPTGLCHDIARLCRNQTENWTKYGGAQPCTSFVLDDSASGCNLSQEVELLLVYYLGQAMKRGGFCCPLVKGTLPELTPPHPGYTCIGTKQVPMKGPKPTFKNPWGRKWEAVDMGLSRGKTLSGCSFRLLRACTVHVAAAAVGTWCGAGRPEVAPEVFNTLNSWRAMRQIQREVCSLLDWQSLEAGILL